MQKESSNSAYEKGGSSCEATANVSWTGITIRMHIAHNYNGCDDHSSSFFALGDRFRCIIDELWYYGSIQAVSPFNDEFPTSSFLCLGVK